MLTALFLSCRRIEYLRRTFTAIRNHFQEVEPGIQVTWACFDNGSDAEEQASLASMGFDILVLSKGNLGIGPAMNRLVSVVRTPFFLNLQDDWVIENPGCIPFVSKCFEILNANPKLGQIKLDACHFLDFKDRSVYDGPFGANDRNGANSAGIHYFVQNPHMLWGGFTFPPAITRTHALYELGPFREDQPFRRGWAESEYSARFSKRYCVAKSPQMVLFRHIGEETSKGWGAGEKVHTSESSARLSIETTEGVPESGTKIGDRGQFHPSEPDSQSQRKLDFVATGCGRSGTGYTSKLLSHLGIHCGHEAVFGDWLEKEAGPIAPLRHGNETWGDSSWLAAAYLGRLCEGVQILHQIRNPISVVRSLMGIEFFSPNSDRGHARFAKRQLPQLERYRTPIERCMAYWLHWNRKIEQVAGGGESYFRYRVEDLADPRSGALCDLLGRIGVTIQPERCRGALAAIPLNVNGRHRDDLVRWTALPDGLLKEELRNKAETYGYTERELETA